MKHSTRTTDPEQVGPDDLVTIDLDGQLVSGTELPPAERFIHTEIYRRRPEVGGIVHTHQPKATLLGVIGAQLLPLLHIPSVLTDTGAIPTWPYPLLVTTPERGKAVADAMRLGSACHLQGHGLVTVGGDLRQAVIRALAVEQLADANLLALQAGRRPRVITEEEQADLRATAASIDGRWAYFEGRLRAVARPGTLPTHN